jgi:hypothetical protein
MKITRLPNFTMSYPELRGKIAFISFPAFVETKLDGELNVYLPGTGIVNKNGKTRTSCPITDYLESIDAVLWGELYYPPGRNGDLYGLLSHPDSDSLCFSIFDITRYKECSLEQEPYVKRREILLEVLPQGQPDCVKVVPTIMANSLQETQSMLKYICQQGYEGIVIKNASSPFLTGSCNWVKIKPVETVDVPVTFIDPVREKMEINYNGRSVSVKLNNKYRHMVSPGDIVEISHNGVLSRGSLRHPRFSGKICQHRR